MTDEQFQILETWLLAAAEASARKNPDTLNNYGLRRLEARAALVDPKPKAAPNWSGALLAALSMLVADALYYDGPNIVIRCESHADAIRRVYDARRVIEKATQ